MTPKCANDEPQTIRAAFAALARDHADEIREASLPGQFRALTREYRLPIIRYQFARAIRERRQRPFVVVSRPQGRRSSGRPAGSRRTRRASRAGPSGEPGEPSADPDHVSRPSEAAA